MKNACNINVKMTQAWSAYQPAVKQIFAFQISSVSFALAVFFLENIIHRANRKKGCREECHVYT